MRGWFNARLLTAILLAISLVVVRSSQADITLGDMTAETGIAREGGWLLLNVTLNGHGPYWFYFDTGSPNLMTHDVAQELGLETHGQSIAEGYGKLKLDTTSTTVDSVRIGGLKLYHQDFVVADLPQYIVDRGNRPKLAGLIGSNLLTRFVTHIDWDAQTMTFIPANDFTYAGTGKVLDVAVGLHLSLWNGLQSMATSAAAVDGISGTFLLDTGDTGGISLYPDTPLAQHVRDKYGKGFRVVSPGGIGGPVAVDFYRTDTFGIAGKTGQSPLIGLMVDGSGSITRHHSDMIGSIGLGIFGRSNVTIDFPHQKFILDPRKEQPAQLSAKSAAYMVNGLQLTKDAHDCFTVLNVVPGSSADKAGIAQGDHIFRVNGRPVTDLALFDYSTIESDNDSITVDVGGDSTQRTVTLQKTTKFP